MKRLIIVAGLIGAIYFLGTSAFLEIQKYIGSATLILSGMNQHTVTSTIIDYYNKNILSDSPKLDAHTPVQIETAYINNDSRKDIIASIESPHVCGTGGCVTTIFLQTETHEIEAIPFAFAVKEIRVKDSITNHMHDLEINGDKTAHMSWNGTQYLFESI
jgi:hypothetical protein